jgi:hypothetical protein
LTEGLELFQVLLLLFLLLLLKQQQHNNNNNKRRTICCMSLIIIMIIICSRGGISCRTNILLCRCIVYSRRIDWSGWRPVRMVVVRKTMWFGRIEWETRETSWCLLFLVDSVYFEYIRKGIYLFIIAYNFYFIYCFDMNID